MAERRNLDRLRAAQGSQPAIHDHPTIDALTGMVIALLGEVSVLRDRLDTNERLSAARGGHTGADVDAWQPDADAVAERARRRDAGYDRVLGAARDALTPAALRQEQAAYDRVLDDVSKP